MKDELTETEFRQFADCIADDLKNGGKLFGIEICKEYNLNECGKAVQEIDTCHGGKKILLNCF